MIHNFPSDILHHILEKHFHFTTKHNYKNAMYLRSTCSQIYDMIKSYCDNLMKHFFIYYAPSMIFEYRLNSNHIPELCIRHDLKCYNIPCNISCGSFEAKHVKETNTKYSCLFSDPRNEEIYVYLKKIYKKRNETNLIVIEEESRVFEKMICERSYNFLCNFFNLS